MSPPGGRPKEVEDGEDVRYRVGRKQREHLERVRVEEQLRSEAAAVRWLIDDDERRRDRRAHRSTT